MNKAIKKEIEKQLNSKNPRVEWQRILSRYLEEIAGSDKAVIVSCRYIRGFGYWKTLKELNRQGHYLSQTVFYNRLEEALGEIALRAAYERQICPYCLGGAEDER